MWWFFHFLNHHQYHSLELLLPFFLLKFCLIVCLFVWEKWLSGYMMLFLLYLIYIIALYSHVHFSILWFLKLYQGLVILYVTEMKILSCMVFVNHIPSIFSNSTSPFENLGMPLWKTSKFIACCHGVSCSSVVFSSQCNANKLKKWNFMGLTNTATYLFFSSSCVVYNILNIICTLKGIEFHAI